VAPIPSRFVFGGAKKICLISRHITNGALRDLQFVRAYTEGCAARPMLNGDLGRILLSLSEEIT